MSTPVSAHPHRRAHQRSRRHLIRLAGALVALLTLVTATACSSAVDELKSGSGERQEGGTLRVGALQDIVPARIFTNSSDSINVLIGSVYDSLIDYPLDSLDPKPSLATSWQLSDDGKQLTLQLRDDVKFHSGRPFTSKDVEFSIKTWADPAWTVQLQRTAAAITGFDTTDEHAITLTFAHPLSNIFDLLDMLPIIDQDTIDQLREGKAFVGTGPFEFTSWSPGAKIQFTRNDDYWRGKPALDGIDVSVIPDPQAQVAQLRSHQLDLILGASYRDFESLGKDDQFNVNQWDGAEGQVYVGTNVTNPALSDVRVRQAIAYALDRKRVVDEVFRGAGVPISLPWPDYSPAYDATANGTYDYDLDQAKKLVDEAKADGVKIPKLPLTYPSENPIYGAIAQIAQADLAKVGIEVELDPQEQAQVIQQLIGAKFPALWILSHGYANWTPSTLAVSAYPFNAEHNASLYVDKDYQAIADKVWKEKPDAVDTADYATLSQALLKGSFLLEIAITLPQDASSTQVHGIGQTKRGEPVFYDTYLSK
ncbi:ABC transporter substrate-binding protein [Pimelobacter simplex]|uniref:ABC transporter substrate-binding protein n=1 Tax=Nocardioides simplex TaxID=2045 RepID=UPI00215065C0|nr:ABC transporter substrate-binding protein [Pimelobacter simplex]UUW91267.1 ABC transporter substrate-binding protein [Pimelobacter simplex]UUW95095.1 ABC transporter substrate-binding protein [Pimelobacter simplex]